MPLGKPRAALSGGATVRVALVLDPTAPAAALPSVPGIDMRLHLAELAVVVPTLPFLRRADMLIVEIVPERPGQIEAFARLATELLPLVVIAAVHDLGVADTRALIRAGAIDVLPLPLEAADVVDAVATALKVSAKRPPVLAAKGRIISFARAVGGAGATALACQTGCLWAASKSTCLIDLDVQFGSVALYLDMAPQLGLLDLVDARERLDATLFTTIAARHASGLHIVAGASEMVPLEILTPSLVGQILALAAQLFDIVLVDLPAAWTSWSLAALAQSDSFCLVTNLSVPGLRQARRQLDVVEANGLTVPMQIVLNRVPKRMFRTIELADTERVLRRKVDFTIANDPHAMENAINQGRPIAAIQRGTRVEKDLRAMIAALDQLLVP